MSPAQTLTFVILALAGVFALITAIVAGFLRWLTGSHPADAILRGSTAFAGTLALLIVVLTTAGLV